jgi:membrane dipeptidase
MIRAIAIAIAALVWGGCKKSEDKKVDTPPPQTASRSADAPPAKAEPPTLERATEIAKKHVMVDGHVDLPWRLDNGKKADGSLAEDPGEATESGEFDHPRAVAGGLDAPFMSIYIPARYQAEGGAKKLADKLIDMVEGLAEKHQDKFAMATSPDEILANKEAGKVSLPMGIENGAAIEGKLENLAHFHGRGVRYITLTHSKDNKICDSSYADTRTHRGLSDFGKNVVAEMNRLGIMIDISHVSDDAFHQVVELTEVPVIASHSSARKFTPGFERNMSDEMIKKLAKNGGVIMINYGSTFVTKAAHAHRDKRKAAVDAFKAKNGMADEAPEVEEFLAAWKKKNPFPFADVSDVAGHIMHVIGLVGVDHVGLGSDFDGVGDSLPTGLKDPADLPNLIKILLERGVSETDIAKIMGGNVLRVWRAVEAHAATARAAAKPAE